MAAAEAQPQLRPERFGRYVLLEKIGQGGMAEVFRAVAPGMGGFRRVLVLKRILPDMSRDPRFVQMFVDEAKISALISHPNVVQVFEFGKIEDAHFLAMEYVHGRNLSTVMGKLATLGRLPPPDVIAEIVRQAALGLHHAHSMNGADGTPLGIIHRDVTPANIMIGFAGAVKVLDFGIARAAEEVKEARTQAGAVKGKVAYLAPEQINRQPVDHRSDLFALGVVLHECLTGQRLFKADNPLAAMKAILEMPIPPPSRLNPDVPPRLDRVVARALQRKPELRYPNGKAMAMDLEAVLVEQRYFSQRLPSFLKELFQDEVTESKDRILPAELAAIEALPEEPEIELRLSTEQEAQGARAGRPATPPVPPRAPPPPPPGATGLNTAAVGTGSASPLPVEKSAALPLPAARRSRWLLGGAVGAAALMVLAFVLGGRRGAPPAAAPEPLPVAPAEPPPPEPPPPARTTVQISVDSLPQGARILGPDGADLGATPATLTFERGGEPLTLVLALAGHADETVTLIPDLDKPVLARLRELPRPRTPGDARPAAPARKPPPKPGLMPRDPFAR